MSKKGVADYADTVASSSPNFDSALAQGDSPSPSPTTPAHTNTEKQEMSAVHPAPPETTTTVPAPAPVPHPVSLHPLPPVNVSLHHHHASDSGHHVASPSASSSSVPQLPPVHAHHHHHHHHTANHSSSLALAAATGSRPSSRPQSARDRNGDAAEQQHGDYRLGHGPAAFDNDGRHSFRAKAIPLVGKDVSARTGIGAVDLAAGLLHHLANNTEGGSRRTSLQKPDAQQPQQPPSGRRPGTGPGPAEGPESGRGLRRMDSTGKRGSGGPLSGRRSSNDKHKMIPLGRVGTVRSMIKSEDGEIMAATKSQHGSRAVSKIGRSGHSSGQSSRLGDGEEGDDQKPQEIEGLDEFDAKQREEIKIGMAKRRQTIAVTGKDLNQDEENIDEGDLAVREAIEAKKMQKKQIFPIGQAIMDWLDGGWGTFIMTIATIFCLFGDDIRVMGVPKIGDTAFEVLSMIFFVLFAWEFGFFCLWKEDYNWTFFFFLDLIAVFSLIPDMTFIWEPFMSSIGQSDF